jgi:hypothetical protein
MAHAVHAVHWALCQQRLWHAGRKVTLHHAKAMNSAMAVQASCRASRALAERAQHGERCMLAERAQHALRQAAHCCHPIGSRRCCVHEAG